MSDPLPLTTETFTARAGSNGEALVTAPSGRVEFMGLWQFFRFCLAAARAGHKIEVQK
ncbi:protein of unknown function (plasmid) [Rhodovastum atsumiense]|uniref:hypothetical protein n=1 Tax=Rhodovastum atsumiense TaxID=504468 RepID=UPI00139F2CEE|nr:hypothetical protein [Rhodovastum atsumiense]CAH2606486.1 protein of unknown function [Rhodovastum atsumiense]